MIRIFLYIFTLIWFSISVEARVFDEDGILIVEFNKRFEYLYFSKNPPSINEIGQKYGYRYIINASFFDGWRNNAKHAGWLKIFGNIHSKIKIDRQLTHIAILDANNKLEFVDYKKFTNSNDSQQTIEFQTGPLVIDENQITTNYINSSINGNGKYRRTLIGFTSDGKKYFIVTRIRITLSDLANRLLKNSIFRGKTLSVVNLDGGPSVALYIKDNHKLSFNTKSKLPLLLVVE